MSALDRDYFVQCKALGPDNANLASTYRTGQVKSCVVELYNAISNGLKQWNYIWAKGPNQEHVKNQNGL